MKKDFHQIKEVYPLRNYELCVNFVDGKTVLYDIKPLFKEIKCFNELKKDKKFYKIHNDGFGVSWNSKIDLDGEEIYQNGKKVKNPFDELISFKDATKYWKLSESTLRKAVSYGKLRQGIDCIKFGNSWVATKSALLREYGLSEYDKDSNFVYYKDRNLIDPKEKQTMTKKQYDEIVTRNGLKKIMDGHK